MNLKERIFTHSDEVIKSALKTLMDNKEAGKVLAGKEVVKDNEKLIEFVTRIEDFADIIANNGFDVNNQRYVSLTDFDRMVETLNSDFSLNSLGFVIGQTITRLTTKLDRPDLEAWMFVSRDLVLPYGSVIYNVILGNEGSATTRIAEAGEYNSFKLDSTEDYIKTGKGKIGIKASYSEEAAKHAGTAAIKMLAEAALADMKRFKSLEAIHLLEANAKSYYDGLDTNKAASIMGQPSGVSYKDPAIKNGTLIMRDIEQFLMEQIAKGLAIDTMYINPLGYNVLVNEPAIREYLKLNANIHFIVPKRVETIAQNMVTKMTKVTSTGAGASKQSEGIYYPQINGMPAKMIANASLNVIVTPLVAYHSIGQVVYTPGSRYASNKVQLYPAVSVPCTDILMIDSSRALIHTHDGTGIISDTAVNKLNDTTDIKFREYYSFILEKDHGVFAFRNISVTNDVFNPYDMSKAVVSIPHTDLF